MGVLSMDNMLSPYDMDNLFNEDVPLKDKHEEKSVEETTESKEEKTITEERVSPEDLFKPESVGNEENNEGSQEKDTSTSEGGDSPNDFYSSIAKAFEEDGVFPDLTDDDFKDVKDAASLRALIDKQISAGLDERQKRIETALNAGIPSDEVVELENTTNVLNSITDEAISAEDAQGENLRKNLIYQSFINRGYSDARAQKMVEKSLAAGTDVEDAKEALEDNKEFYKDKYDTILKNAKKAQEENQKKIKKQAEDLKKSILEEDKVFGDITLDKNTRQLIYKNMMEPTYKNPETGQYLTAIQKYQQDNPQEFFKNVGLLYTLTDGFKNIDKLVKGKVTKEINKGIRHLESVINTSGSSGGSVSFLNGRSGGKKTAFSGLNFDK